MLSRSFVDADFYQDINPELINTLFLKVNKKNLSV